MNNYESNFSNLLTKAKQYNSIVDTPSLLLLEPETEPLIEISTDLRTITVPKELENLAVESDYNSETVYFSCPRYFDGRDLSEHKCIICYNNAFGDYGESEAIDITINTNTLKFGWVIDKNVTVKSGIISFQVVFETTTSYRWGTQTATANILKGLTINDKGEKSDVTYWHTITSQIEELINTIKQYLPLKGGKLTGKLVTRDVYVGGDFEKDEMGKDVYDPYAGRGKSSLSVSGTLRLFGQVFAEVSSFAIKALKVLNEVEIGGSLTVENETRIKNALRVDSELRVDGRIKAGGTLDMKQNDIKNVKSLEVEGSANLLNDVYIRQSGSSSRNDENRYKLSDILEEVTDGGFKNRYVVGKHGGMTFAEQLQATINACPDGGVVFIPYSKTVYVLDNIVVINKNITLLGDIKGVVIDFRFGHFTEEETVLNFICKNIQFGVLESVNSFSCSFYDFKNNISFYNCSFKMPYALLNKYNGMSNILFNNCTFIASIVSSLGNNLDIYKITLENCTILQADGFSRITGNSSGLLRVTEIALKGINIVPDDNVYIHYPIIDYAEIENILCTNSNIPYKLVSDNVTVANLYISRYEIPTKLSELINDSEYMTKEEVQALIAEALETTAISPIAISNKTENMIE